ncbi:hypothetical protein [Variovorax rhizosphaerae]|uniref:Uncharacterized protein n=1 Tax=Variovorax rhizosphaerae TaxID=1836200 RepID=A0ABU8WRK3_9BURK
MRSLFEAQQAVLAGMTSDSDRFSYVGSILRSLFQTAAVTALEIVRELTPDPLENTDLAALAKRFDKPSDGLPVEVLELVTPIIRGHVQRTYHLGWFERDPHHGDTLASAATAWISFRNRKPGHGVVSKADIDEWTPKLSRLLQRSLACFSMTLPRVEPEGLKVRIGNQDLELRTPIVREGCPIVVSGVAARKGIWKLHGQTLAWAASDSFSIDLAQGSVFAEFEASTADKFGVVAVDFEGQQRMVFSNVPVRQTSTFEGRAQELGKLMAWINDPEERMLLIYGDGGFGKTTLALEFLNRIFDGETTLAYKPPSVVSYYSAKMTRWTDQGLVHLQGISGAMEDCVRELMFCLGPVLDKSYYQLNGTALIDKVATEFKKQGFDHDDVLIVLDNTETLATSPESVEALGVFLKQVGRKLGRVLLTSRRREQTAFEPLQVSALSDSECISLMRRLAGDHHTVAILQAGDATLRKYSNKLGNKPLLIDILVKYLARSTIGIEDAVDQVFRKSSDELQEFLYEDAWLRINELQRDVFLVLVSTAVPLDGKCVGDACALVEIQHIEFQKALDETYFGMVTDYGDRYDLQLVDMAEQFFRGKLKRRGEVGRERIEQFARQVDTLATDRQRAQQEYRSDRVAEGFRSSYAKAAKIAAERGDFGGAEENFQLALLEEPMNAALHDRFAWFLLNRRQRPELARPQAERAVKLDPDSADASLTLALCWYRLNELDKGDAEIKAAQRKGKAVELCQLRMGIARYYAAKEVGGTGRGYELLKEGKRYIEEALRALDPASPYLAKNLREAYRYERSLLALEYQFNRSSLRSEDH